MASGLGPYGFSFALSFATPGGGPYKGSVAVEAATLAIRLPLVEPSTGTEVAPARKAEPPKKLRLPILKALSA